MRFRWKQIQPIQWCREVRWHWQRAFRGYADSDVWGFDDYLAEVIEHGVEALRKEAHGWPGDDGEAKTFEDWQRILGEIAWTFKVAGFIGGGYRREWRYPPDGVWTQEWYDRTIEFDKGLPFLHQHVMTNEEVERYDNGWRLFKKYFFHLWD